MNRKTRITLVVLLAVGAVGWAGVTSFLKKNDGLAFQPNALHLKGSPYGRTLALAMRGPADVYWHRGEGGNEHVCGPGCAHESHGESEEGGCGHPGCTEQHEGCDHEQEVCEHDHGGCDHEQGLCEHDHDGCDHEQEVCEHDHGGCDHEQGVCEHDHGGCDHEQGLCEHDHDGCDHEHGECEHAQDSGRSVDPGGALAAMMSELAAEHAEHEAHHDADLEEDTTAAEFEGVRPYLLNLIGDMRRAYHSRNNRRGESNLHRAFVMGETQRRLALSYEMDPTNIACYGSYFMFLAEALARVEGAEGEQRVIQSRLQAALQLSNYTIRYCLRFPDEAPAMVTAAVAAHDYVQIQLSVPDPDLEEAAQVLQILDRCIENYEEIRETMIGSGTWENFPEHRRGDMEKAYKLVKVLRDADHLVFKKLSGSSVAAPEAPSEEGVASR